MLNLIRKIDDLLAKTEEIILVAILVMLMGLGFLQVILRNFFESGFIWADVFLRHLVLWLGLIGASLATKHNKHLNMDALSRLMKPKTVVMVSVFINIIASLISAIFVIASYYFVKDEFEFGEGKSLFFGVTAWQAQIIIPAVFIIITLRFFFKGIDLAISLSRNEEVFHKAISKTGPLISDTTGPLIERQGKTGSLNSETTGPLNKDNNENGNN